MTSNRRLGVYARQRGIQREHRQIAGWGGIPGRCGVECECGVTFDHFDTIAEADALLQQHIASAVPLGLTPKQRRRLEKKAARDAKLAVLAGAA